MVAGGHVQVVALDLAGRRLGAVHALHAEQEAVAPAHERLAVDVLVVLGEVQPAAQRLVDHAAVVARRKAELGLDGRAEQRAAVLVQVLALHHDAVRRSLEGLGIVRRDAHILEAQRPQRLEAEHVADDRGGEIGDRAFLEQVEIVGDVGDVLVRARHRLDPVALGLVVLVGRQPVRPDDRPGGRGGFAGDGRRRLDRLDAFLRHKAERAENVRVLRFVIGLVVTHLRIRRDAGGPASLVAVAVDSLCHLSISLWDRQAHTQKSTYGIWPMSHQLIQAVLCRNNAHRKAHICRRGRHQLMGQARVSCSWLALGRDAQDGRSKN